MADWPRVDGHAAGQHYKGLAQKFSGEYEVWRGIKSRCHTPSHRSWKNYGGRGIQVFEGWRENFAAFLEHIGPRPSRKHTLDRIDNDRGYEPGNVRWATRREQARNTRLNHRITVGSLTLTIAEWAERSGLMASRISDRIRQGWDPADAVTIPADPNLARHSCPDCPGPKLVARLEAAAEMAAWLRKMLTPGGVPERLLIEVLTRWDAAAESGEGR